MKPGDLSLMSIWNRTNNDKIHKQKLLNIRNRSRDVSHSPPETLRYLDSFQRRSMNHEKVKAKDIENGNLKLFKKLNRILDCKRSLSVKLSQISDNLGPRSLNYSFKRREAVRIQQENEAMARRIDGKNPSLNLKQLRAEFKKQSQYSKQISKNLLLEKLKKIHSNTSRHKSRKSSQMNNEMLTVVQEEVTQANES